MMHNSEHRHVTSALKMAAIACIVDINLCFSTKRTQNATYSCISGLGMWCQSSQKPEKYRYAFSVRWHHLLIHFHRPASLTQRRGDFHLRPVTFYLPRKGQNKNKVFVQHREQSTTVWHIIYASLLGRLKILFMDACSFQTFTSRIYANFSVEKDRIFLAADIGVNLISAAKITRCEQN